jgi:hypothetical protein
LSFPGTALFGVCSLVEDDSWSGLDGFAGSVVEDDDTPLLLLFVNSRMEFFRNNANFSSPVSCAFVRGLILESPALFRPPLLLLPLPPPGLSVRVGSNVVACDPRRKNDVLSSVNFFGVGLSELFPLLPLLPLLSGAIEGEDDINPGSEGPPVDAISS